MMSNAVLCNFFLLFSTCKPAVAVLFYVFQPDLSEMQYLQAVSPQLPHCFLPGVDAIQK